MRERALAYYAQGLNCAQCILAAAADQYQMELSPKQLQALNPISAGFGIGGFCSVLVAVLMVFGMLFDEEEAKSLRTRFLFHFQEQYGCLNCGMLSRGDCSILIGDAAEWMQQLIDEAHKRRGFT